MSTDVERILERGSLEDLESLLDAAEAAGDDESAVLAALDTGETGTAEQAAPADAPPRQEQQAPEQPQPRPAEQVPPTDEPPVVLARDGKHTIPYSELEASRERAAALARQVDELQRLNGLYKSQLTAAEISPKELPENIRFTEEQIREAESFGTLGEMVAVLAQQNQALLERLNSQSIPREEAPQVEEQPDPVIASNPELASWWRSDPVRWNVAEAIDGGLQADPRWAGKSLQERIPEIVRRTKLSFGEVAQQDAIEERAARALQSAAPRVPHSLTDVGGEVPGSAKPVVEQLQEGSVDDVARFLERGLATGKSMDELLSQFANL